jgi:hypothetical protein
VDSEGEDAAEDADGWDEEPMLAGLGSLRCANGCLCVSPSVTYGVSVSCCGCALYVFVTCLVWQAPWHQRSARDHDVSATAAPFGAGGFVNRGHQSHSRFAA